MTVFFTVFISFLRTIVPAIVGAITGSLVSAGLTVDPEFEVALSSALFAVFTGLYYLIVRLIELKVPNVGILLGWASTPDYSKGVDNVAPVHEDKIIPGTTLPGLDRIPGPDHRA